MAQILHYFILLYNILSILLTFCILDSDIHLRFFIITKLSRVTHSIYFYKFKLISIMFNKNIFNKNKTKKKSIKK